MELCRWLAICLHIYKVLITVVVGCQNFHCWMNGGLVNGELFQFLAELCLVTVLRLQES